MSGNPYKEAIEAEENKFEDAALYLESAQEDHSGKSEEIAKLQKEIRERGAMQKMAANKTLSMIEEGEEDLQKDNSNDQPEESKKGSGHDEETLYFQSNTSQEEARQTFDHNKFQRMQQPASPIRGRKQTIKGKLDSSVERGRSIFSGGALQSEYPDRKPTVDNITRITGFQSQFADENLGNEYFGGDYQEIDMGHFEEEEKQFFIYDKDSQQFFDTRKEADLKRLTQHSTTAGTLSTSAQRFLTSSQDVKISPKAWQDWYKKKREVNQNLITAAEFGQLENVQ